MCAEAIHIRTIPFVLVCLYAHLMFYSTDLFFSHTNLVTENLKYSAHILFIIINASFKLTIRKFTFSFKNKYTEKSKYIWAICTFTFYVLFTFTYKLIQIHSNKSTLGWNSSQYMGETEPDLFFTQCY